MKGFYSRETELSLLESKFKNLAGPEIIQVIAPSGVGKTRLVQEFYSKIASRSNYWQPIRSQIGKKEIEVIPKYETSDSKLDWLFLSTRSTEKNEHKYDFAFDKIRHQFCIHLPQIIKALKGKSLNKKIAKSTISILANFAVPGSGNVVEIINTVKDLASDSSDVITLIQDIRDKTKNKSSSHENKFYAEQTKSLIQSTISVFNEIFKKDKDFRIIIYFEDFHWVDQFSQIIISEIITKAFENKWNILFVISNWPKEGMKRNSYEAQTLDYFSLQLSKFETDIVTKVKLEKLKNNGLKEIVNDRLPYFDENAGSIVIERCKGDLDLLNDFIDEIIQTPGWLNEKGELQVEYTTLKSLPAKAIDMARSRLLAFPEIVRNHLLWSSVQGIEFDFSIINTILEKYSLKNEYRDSLQASNEDFKVITIRKNSHLTLTCEFKRAVFFESAKTLIERHPLIDRIRYDLVHVLANLLNGLEENIDSDRIRLIECFLSLIIHVNPITPELMNTKIKSLIEVSRHKILLGDYNGVIRICEDLISQNIEYDLKNNLYFLLTEAYYYKGDAQNEAKIFDLWLRDDIEEDYSFEIQYSKYLRRNSRPKEALNYVLEAMNKVSDPELKMHTSIEYIKNLWSLGKIEQAYEKLKAVEDELKKIESENLKLAFSHAACLVLHDLDKSSQVIQHARMCIGGYEKTGNIQSEIISRVNYADALWALGYLNKASEQLLKASKMATENELPHAVDISKICYANVLSEQRKFSSSEKEYKEGIQLADVINHDWDSIYGNIYSKLSDLRRGYKIDKKEIYSLIEKSNKSDYHYLSDLAYSLLCSFLISENKSILIEFDSFSPTLPLGNIFLCSNLILTNTFDHNTIESFLKYLGKVEGIKFNRETVIKTIDKLLQNNLISDAIYIDFAIRWKNRYSNQIEKDDAIKLKACNYKLCEARCCYDGVYLEDEEEERRIRDIVNQYPNYFTHLPEKYIVEGKWENINGRKTAVKEHGYKSPDFPKHFNKTRCVFALKDGACSLQKLSMEVSDNSWEFKPLGCRVHPLQTKNSEYSAPKSSIEKDKYDVGISYPGYTNHTPCGTNRIDGEIWIDALTDEIEEFEK